MIDELLEYNRAFVGKKGYEKYLTNVTILFSATTILSAVFQPIK